MEPGQNLLILGTGGLLVGLTAMVLVLVSGRSQRQAVTRSLAAIDHLRAGGASASSSAGLRERVLLPALLRLSDLGGRL